MLFSAPLTSTPSLELIAMPPVSRRSFGPSSDPHLSALFSSKLIGSVGACILERHGQRGLGPKKQTRLARGQTRQAFEAHCRLLIIAIAMFHILADIRLNDADAKQRERVGGHRAEAGRSHRKAVACDDHDQRQPFAVIFEPDGAAQEDDQARQAVGADQRGDRDERGRRKRCCGRVPREIR